MLSNSGACRVKSAITASVLVGGLLAGCAPIQSKPLDVSSNAEGLIYYLPKRDVVVTLTKPKDAPATLTVGIGAAYADLSKRYLLTVKGTPLGSRTHDVAVSESGLLKSGNAVLVSNVGEIAAAIASSLGGVPWRLDAAGQSQDCTKLASYSIAIDGGKTVDNFCGFRIEVTATAFPAQAAPGTETSKESSDHRSGDKLPAAVPTDVVHSHSGGAGYYYRQARPYRVRVCPTESSPKACSDENTILAGVLNSPTDAPVQFIPVSKTLFADNDNTVTFSDGVLTQYKEVKGSELLGLTSIPAEVIAAYFKAAGSLFDFLKQKSDSEVGQVNGQLALALAKMRYDACLVAIRNNDKPAMESLDCKSD